MPYARASVGANATRTSARSPGASVPSMGSNVKNSRSRTWGGAPTTRIFVRDGFVDITTRGNFQLREFKPRSLIQVLTRIQELGLASRGAGADNVRNVTASPNSGFDPDELLDVRPFAKGIHHYILNHRDLYGLPRKFNIAFDNGGSISAAADTNDIGFFACRVTEKSLADRKSVV